LPKLLAERLAADSVRQFRVAAQLRCEDAWRLFRANRGTAAIYLWGYCAEMTLKAAYFTLLGYPERQPILLRDLRLAVANAGTCGIQWPPGGGFHAIFHWARLLVEHRNRLGRPYASPAFGDAVVRHSQSVYERWRETLRYKTNRAYPFEVAAVAHSTTWLLENSPGL
jgi:hypothetical protein